MDEVVSAYETYPEVIKKYNHLVEADSGRGNATAADQSDLIETKEGVPVGESDGAGRGAKSIN